MSDTTINVITLPEPLRRRIRSTRVRISEDNGSVILTPITTTESKSLLGLLPDSRFTTEKYLAQKKADKELES